MKEKGIPSRLMKWKSIWETKLTNARMEVLRKLYLVTLKQRGLNKGNLLKDGASFRPDFSPDFLTKNRLLNSSLRNIISKYNNSIDVFKL